MDDVHMDDTDGGAAGLAAGSGAGSTGRLLPRFEGIVLEDAPAEVLERVVARFRARTAAAPEPGPITKVAARIRAALAFDDWSAGPALAVRGMVASPTGPRHLVYTVGAPSGTAEIAISLYPIDGSTDGGRVTIVGQLLSDDPATHLVEVVAADGVVASTTSSAFGEFTVEVPADWDEIVLVGPDADLVVARDAGGVERP